MQTLDSVLAKIRKLLALADSPNEHEAATAAARAAELMAKYEIETAQLEADGGEVTHEDIGDEVVDVAQRGWHNYIAKGVALLSDVKMYLVRTKYRGKLVQIRLFGRLGPVRTATYMYTYLSAEVDRLAVQGWRDNSDMSLSAVSFKHGFRIGCAHRLLQRMKEMKAEQATEWEAVGAKALAVVQRRDDELADAFAKLGTKTRKRNLLCGSAAAMEAGTTAAEGVDIRAGGRPQLGAAPGRIAGR